MDLIAKAKAESEEAELILSEVVDGGTLTADKSLFLDSIGIVGDKRKAELGRIGSVRRFQRRLNELKSAATDDELTAAMKRKDAETGPLRDQIAAAQRRLDALENDVTTLTKRRDGYLTGLGYLMAPDLLPPSVRCEYDTAKSALASTKCKLTQATNRLKQIETLTSLDDDKAIEWLRRQRDYRVAFASCIDVVKVPHAGGYSISATLNIDGWRAYLAKLAPEAVGLRDEIDALQNVYDQQDAECCRIRRHYVN